VGGNNVGKSQFLRDIPACIQGMSANQPTVLIEGVDYNLTLDSATAATWLLANSIELVSHDQPTYYQAPGGGNYVTPGDFHSNPNQNYLQLWTGSFDHLMLLRDRQWLQSKLALVRFLKTAVHCMRCSEMENWNPNSLPYARKASAFR
jgi:hypothetical protein